MLSVFETEGWRFEPVRARQFFKHLIAVKHLSGATNPEKIKGCSFDADETR
jgi:hypothetical protein